MKLIGAGFGRTGTMSLKAALEQIGYGPSFHMIDLIRDPSPLAHWQAATSGERVDWIEAFEGWESSVDWPGCTFWEQLLETWPDVPVLLNVRDPDAWHTSCLNSIHEAKVMALRGELRPPNESEAASSEVIGMINDLIWNGTFHGRFTDKAYATDVFRRHNEDVKCKVPAQKLLVWDVTQGWGPLCEFLGVDVPATPFPHLNDTVSFRQMVGLPALA